MKLLLRVAALIALASLPAFAGSKSYHCTSDAQTCLDEMVTDLQNRGWVGIEMDTDDATGLMTITRVIPASPAEKGGFRVGDQLLSVNGIPIGEESSAALRENRKKMVPGAKMEYVVGRAGAKVKVTVELGTLPTDVYYQMIGMHMLDHAKVDGAKAPPEEAPRKP